MHKLLERTAGEYKKQIFLYGAAITALLAIVLVSAVVLNTNALLLNEKPESQNQPSVSSDKLPGIYSLEKMSSGAASRTALSAVNAQGGEETDVKDALLNAGVVFYDEDAVNSASAAPAEKELTVKITADGKTKSLKLSSGKVSDALTAAKITAGKNDIVSPGMDKALKDGMKIKISRVIYREKSEQETIKYKTVISESKKMDYGSTKITQKGQNGKREVTYRVKYVDGKQAGKTVLSRKIIKKAVDKKVTAGTKSAPVSASGSYKVPSQISWIAPPSSVKFDKKGKPVNYKKIMSGTATAYGPQDGTATSTGKKAKPGYVAVDPRVIPYGTKMYIVSADGRYNYGYAIAADTGGAARSGRILVDLFFPSERACYNFGRRQVNIYILP